MMKLLHLQYTQPTLIIKQAKFKSRIKDTNKNEFFMMEWNKGKLLTWNKARQQSTTKLYDRTGREKAIFSHRTITSTDNE